jgi:hypothetical protein
MKRNVGGLDRAFRIALGLVILGLGVYARSWWGALGLLPLLTGVFAWCPVYLPFGMSSCATPSGSRA